MSDADVERLERAIGQVAQAARPDSDVMMIQEAADYLRLSRHTLYKWAAKGTIPHERVGRLLRFSKRAINAWLKQNQRGG